VKPAGLILAAGESRRMGSPKALLETGGETFLDRLIGMFAPHCAPVVVVLGANAGAIRAGIRRGAEALFADNENWTQGQLSSMQCGLRALPPGATGVLFTLVDHPNVRADTVARLLEPGGGLRIPRYGGRRGHPVYWSAPLIAELLALGPQATARDVVERHAAEVEYIDVDDPGVLDDIDVPADYLRLRGARP
jgi:CTP:molybdopterin cytidylyltransferase MocA